MNSKQKLIKLLSLIIIFGVLITACGAPAATQAPAATEAPTMTEVPSHRSPGSYRSSCYRSTWQNV